MKNDVSIDDFIKKLQELKEQGVRLVTAGSWSDPDSLEEDPPALLVQGDTVTVVDDNQHTREIWSDSIVTFLPEAPEKEDEEDA